MTTYHDHIAYSLQQLGTSDMSLKEVQVATS